MPTVPVSGRLNPNFRPGVNSDSGSVPSPAPAAGRPAIPAATTSACALHAPPPRLPTSGGGGVNALRTRNLPPSAAPRTFPDDQLNPSGNQPSFMPGVVPPPGGWPAGMTMPQGAPASPWLTPPGVFPAKLNPEYVASHATFIPPPPSANEPWRRTSAAPAQLDPRKLVPYLSRNGVSGIHVNPTDLRDEKIGGNPNEKLDKFGKCEAVCRHLVQMAADLRAQAPKGERVSETYKKLDTKQKIVQLAAGRLVEIHDVFYDSIRNAPPHSKHIVDERHITQYVANIYSELVKKSVELEKSDLNAPFQDLEFSTVIKLITEYHVLEGVVQCKIQDDINKPSYGSRYFALTLHDPNNMRSLGRIEAANPHHMPLFSFSSFMEDKRDLPEYLPPGQPLTFATVIENADININKSQMKYTPEGVSGQPAGAQLMDLAFRTGMTEVIDGMLNGVPSPTNPKDVEHMLARLQCATHTGTAGVGAAMFFGQTQAIQSYAKILKSQWHALPEARAMDLLVVLTNQLCAPVGDDQSESIAEFGKLIQSLELKPAQKLQLLPCLLRPLKTSMDKDHADSFKALAELLAALDVPTSLHCETLLAADADGMSVLVHGMDQGKTNTVKAYCEAVENMHLPDSAQVLEMLSWESIAMAVIGEHLDAAEVLCASLTKCGADPQAVIDMLQITLKFAEAEAHAENKACSQEVTDFLHNAIAEQTARALAAVQI
jgi:hypothetical protein